MKHVYTFKSLLFFLIGSISSIVLNGAAPAAPSIAYRQAQVADIAGILALINEHAFKEHDKIVILPEKFREGAIAAAVKSGKLFVAELKPHNAQPGTIIGYKKMYCLEGAELPDTLNNELRFVGKPACAGVAAIQAGELEQITKSSQEAEQVLAAKTVFIYDGADYTHPAFRGKGVNTQLTKTALAHAQSSALAALKKNNSTHIALAFGLAQANAGNGILGGRMQGIAKTFIPFAQSFAQALDREAPTQIVCARYHAFMPSFDPKAVECKPLPDDKAVPGFGCLLACVLEKSTKKPASLAVALSTQAP